MKILGVHHPYRTERRSTPTCNDIISPKNLEHYWILSSKKHENMFLPSSLDNLIKFGSFLSYRDPS